MSSLIFTLCLCNNCGFISLTYQSKRRIPDPRKISAMVTSSAIVPVMPLHHLHLRYTISYSPSSLISELPVPYLYFLLSGASNLILIPFCSSVNITSQCTQSITHIAGFFHFVRFLHVWRPGTGEFKDLRCHLTHAYKKGWLKIVPLFFS